MPSRHGVYRDDPNVAAETLAASGAPPAERLQQWRAELDEFVARTRLRLSAMSEALAKCQAAAEQLPEPTNLDDNRDGPRASPRDAAITAVGAQVGTTRTTEDPSTMPAQREAASNDTDLMDRLNAIKLRLAEQIQSN